MTVLNSQLTESQSGLESTCASINFLVVPEGNLYSVIIVSHLSRVVERPRPQDPHDRNTHRSPMVHLRLRQSLLQVTPPPSPHHARELEEEA